MHCSAKTAGSSTQADAAASVQATVGRTKTGAEVVGAGGMPAAAGTTTVSAAAGLSAAICASKLAVSVSPPLSEAGMEPTIGSPAEGV